MTLSAGGKSEKDLISLLRYDNFTEDQIDYAINNLDADYYEQAVWQACFYKYTSSSKYTKSEAQERLKSNGFSDDEIEFAVTTVYEKLK